MMKLVHIEFFLLVFKKEKMGTFLTYFKGRRMESMSEGVRQLSDLNLSRGLTLGPPSFLLIKELSW